MEFKPKSIAEWENVFAHIYSDVDSRRTPEQMWTAVMAHSSAIGESVRKVAFHDIIKAASSTFCWLASFTNKCKGLENDIFSINHSLSQIVSFKYPKICGRCLRSPCKCEPLEQDLISDKVARYNDLYNEWKTISDSVDNWTIELYKDIFRKIYGARIYIQSLESIGFHFLEEIGEAAVCVRELSQLRNIVNSETGIELEFIKEISSIPSLVEQYTRLKDTINKIDVSSKEPEMLKARAVKAKIGLLIEIGDSWSWLFSIMNKLDMISQFVFTKPEKHPEFMIPLEEILQKKYLDKEGNPQCHACKKESCECVFYNLELKELENQNWKRGRI